MLVIKIYLFPFSCISESPPVGDDDEFSSPRLCAESMSCDDRITVNASPPPATTHGPSASAVTFSLHQALDIRRMHARKRSMAVSDDFDTDLPDIQSPLRRLRCSADSHTVRQQTDASHVSRVPATHSAPASSSSQTPDAITHNSSVPTSRAPTVISHNAPVSTACTYDVFTHNATNSIPCKSAATSHDAQTPVSCTLAEITDNTPHTMTNITHKTSVSAVAIPASSVVCAKTAADGFNSGTANKACGQRTLDCEKSVSSLPAPLSMRAVDVLSLPAPLSTRAIDATAVPADPRPSGATAAAPADPRPSGATAAAPADPRPSGATAAAPADPRPSGATAAAPADPRPSGATAAAPADPRPSGATTAAPADPRPSGATTAPSVAMKSAEISVTARPKSREENLQEMTQEVASIFQISYFCKGNFR